MLHIFTIKDVATSNQATGCPLQATGYPLSATGCPLQAELRISPHRNINITTSQHHIATSPHRNIATSPHHNIATSPHHHIATSPHHHIATSPHHHITTSPHLHISTSQHHHISTTLTTLSFYATIHYFRQNKGNGCAFVHIVGFNSWLYGIVSSCPKQLYRSYPLDGAYTYYRWH
ncbi:MAG: hypothetical protein IPN94_08170 [Sphingobacteriales bacterium]|nr:hypothetical protein [Sphingobacteriales bacterium]